MWFDEEEVYGRASSTVLPVFVFCVTSHIEVSLLFVLVLLKWSMYVGG